MNDYQRVDAIRTQWLCPPEYDDPVGRHKCDLCGRRNPYVQHFDLLTCIACGDCVSKRRQCPDDVIQECSVCGIRCDGEVTVVNGDVYCDECMEEAEIREYYEN